MRNILLSSVAMFSTLLISACEIKPDNGEARNAPSTSQAQAGNKTDATALTFAKFLKYETFTLDNGLRVVIHEDRSVPAVSVTTMFHVGSKNEVEGKTGFAHLFEHLLFNGTKNAPGEFFTYLNEIGATGTNGTTNYDRTNYFQTVPTGALERMLWLESDRMVTFIDGLTEKSLRTQIDVVKNEKGLGDNRPFGEASYDQIAYIYPKNHPYSRSIIGSIEDLENASLEDAQKWFKDYYGARNTVLVLSGDINVSEAKPLVEKYFNRMKAGPGISRPKYMPVKRTQNTLQIVTDIASESALERAYVLPPVTNRANYLSSIAINIFGSGENSKLHKTLVEDKKLAKAVNLFSIGGELTNAYTISIVPNEGVAIKDVSEALDEALAAYLKEGPSKTDIKRYQGQLRSFYINASESLQLKGLLLGEALMYHNDPHFDLKTAGWINSAKPEELRLSANEWLSGGYHETHKIAVSEAKTVSSDIDFAKRPDVLPTPQKELREADRFTLSNGLEVVFIQRENSPRILMDYISPVGRAHYGLEAASSTRLLNQMLRSGGLGGVERQALSEHKATIGANVFASVLRESTSIAVSTDIGAFDEAFDIWKDAILSPNFSQDDFEYFKKQSQEILLADLKDPNRVGSQIGGLKIYGDDLYETTQERLDAWDDPQLLDKAKAFFKDNVRPKNARLYVAAGMDKAALKDKLETAFKGWNGEVKSRDIIRKTLPAKPTRPRFLLLNAEGSSQTRLTAIRTLPLDYNKDLYVEDVVNQIWGGGFTSRLNLNIREDKGWTYGISSRLRAVPEMESSWGIGGSVTGTKTVDAIQEIIREITEFNTTRPVSAEELKETVDPEIKSFSNNLGSTFVLPRLYLENDRLGKPHSYMGEQGQRLSEITPQDITDLVPSIIKHEDLTWVLVGDLHVFEDELRAANLGDVAVYDLSGKKIR